MTDLTAGLKIFMQMVLLVIAIVLLISLVRGFGYPHRQEAFANTELLRLAMNKACAAGPGTVIELDGFSLPQNIPPDFDVLPYLGGQFPRMFITTNGDPTYNLYYESFPPGEAIGWEVYTYQNLRFVQPVPDSIEGKDIIDAEEVIEQNNINILERWAAGSFKFPTESLIDSSASVLDTVIFPNLVLQSNVPEKIGQLYEKDPQLTAAGDVGFWVDKGSYKFYQFNTYALLTTTNKTLPKYRSCGPGNLCLKTNDGIYAFPLESCKNNQGQMKIKNIQMVYNVKYQITEHATYLGITAGGGAAIGTVSFYQLTKFAVTNLAKKLSTKILVGIVPGIGTGISATWLLIEFKNFLIYPSMGFYLDKKSDFYLSSPCAYKGKVLIEYSESCECEKLVTYPVYDVDRDGKVVKVGEHSSCVKYSKSEKIPAYNDDYGDAFNGNYQCLKVTFEPDIKDNFCWTSNLKPILNSASYMKDQKGIVLGDGTMNNAILEEDEGFLKSFTDMNLLLRWRWPQSKI